MQELIKVTTNAQGERVVSARDLHEYLESKQQFSDWIKNRIEKYGLVESQDFVTFSEIYEKGRPRINYALTLDAAKELAMVEGNDKGKAARQYFIECERALKEKSPISPLPLSTEQQLAQAVLLATSVIAQKDQEIKLLKPKAEYTDVVLSSKSCHTTTEIAKELGMPSARELNSQLCQRGIQYKHRGHYVLTAKYADKKYTTTNTIAYVDSKGEVATREHMVWTEYGRVFLHNLFNSQLSFSKARKEVAHV